MIADLTVIAAFLLVLAALTTLASLLTRGRVKAFVVALMGGVE